MLTRNTHQRATILDVLNHCKDHPTAQVLYERVVKKLPHVSKATVYRNLQVLQDEGKVRQVPIGGTARFESMECGEHDHFVCAQCQKIVDLDFPALDKRALTSIKNKHPELDVSGVTISWTGVCGACKGGSKHGRKTLQH